MSESVVASHRAIGTEKRGWKGSAFDPFFSFFPSPVLLLLLFFVSFSKPLVPHDPPPHTHTHTHTYTHTHSHTHTHTYTQSHTHTRTQSHTHTRTHRHIHTHTHTFTYRHTHTHTHTHTPVIQIGDPFQLFSFKQQTLFYELYSRPGYESRVCSLA